MADKLTILWTNADKITAEKMVFMYAINSKTHNWWEEVTVLIWGATAKLTAEDLLIQQNIELAQHVGVRFIACKACADQLGVSETLIGLGVEVTYTGELLTEIIKEGEKLITI